MAQFPLSDLLTGVKRLFVGVQGKRTDGAYTDLKITNNGELFVSTIGSNTLQGKVKSVTTAGTKVQLDDIPSQEVTVIARKENTGFVYVGGSDVTSLIFGIKLSANESFTFRVSNANMIYIDASVSGEGISYVAI